MLSRLMKAIFFLFKTVYEINVLTVFDLTKTLINDLKINLIDLIDFINGCFF